MRIKELEKLFKVLGNKRRLRIVKLLLKTEEISVSDIASEIGLSFRATSRHLLQLFHIDILRKEQRVTKVFYKISNSLSPTAKNIINHIHHSAE